MRHESSNSAIGGLNSRWLYYINNKASDIVVVKKGSKTKFSIGYLAEFLMKIGLSYEQAYHDAAFIAKELIDLNMQEITSDELLTYAEEWYASSNPIYARRLSVLAKDMAPVRPFVIMLGGVTGIGKSTIARLLAERLEVKSLIGTDLIRETLRTVFSSNLMPTLHTSSYTASSKISSARLIPETRTLLGFEEQAKIVITGAEAASLKTIRQNEVLILEGVHLVPGMVNRKLFSNPSLIQVLLVLTDEETHYSRLKKREKGQIRGTQYSSYFDKIRKIQDYLIEKATEYGVKTIDVTNDEETLIEIINYVWEQLLDERKIDR